ncbi:L-talarate/galactarate dehydratase [Bergeriella denitrificans]|uniref:Mandelate racemase n=1 Tax=Bergeriella denitrificans TaxID=494 RepID=A0A378UJ40_BERDE|nr:L-talarate/galactarate dehydratase [Bergeriella denitrificans]STZ76502.1 Mandelate racemase [Bergeriella denitrificans]
MSVSGNSDAVSYAKVIDGKTAADTGDRIEYVKVSLAFLPLSTPVSDAKVLTGRQKPLTEVAIVFAEIRTRDGYDGIGFSYSKRAGGYGIFAHAKEIADNLLGEDPNDIDKIYTKLLWAGASVGRSGMAVQAISPFDVALWDMKAKRAKLPLAKLFGAHRDSVRCYNTSGGFLHTPLDQVLKNVAISRESGIGGIKLKVGHPDNAEDLKRLTAVRKELGDFPLMVDANQQWDRDTAIRMGRKMEQFDLVWIEEPLDAYDVEGHAALTAALDTPIATGEMLTSYREHEQLILGNASDFVQPDAPRVGGITPFLRIMELAHRHGRKLAPHFAMEIHLHLAAAYPIEPWLEHFEWLNPLFNEQLELRDGRMWVSDRYGLGVTMSEQAVKWTVQTAEFGKQP